MSSDSNPIPSTSTPDPNPPTAPSPTLVKQPSQTTKKRKLACFLCRDRRVRCDWPDDAKKGCIACAQARIKCPGEPQPKKRLRKGEPPSKDGPSSVDIKMRKYRLGSAQSISLIELSFDVANPSIPGLPYDFLRTFIKEAGGKSREAEVAAEVLCGAFIAKAAAFSDDPIFLTSPTPFHNPLPSPLPSPRTYTPLLPHSHSSSRSDALSTLILSSRQLLEDSGMRLRPSIEALWAMWACDQAWVLGSEKGREDREAVEGLVGCWRELLKGDGMTEEEREMLEGPVGIALLALDAESAATLRTSCSITETDLSKLVPHFATLDTTTLAIDPEILNDEETGWTELGKALGPLSLSTTTLYRSFVKLRASSFSDPATLAPLYTALDSSHAYLLNLTQQILSLPPTPDGIPLFTAWRAFDLLTLVHFFRRSLLRLDLLLHQRIIEALLASQSPGSASSEAGTRGPRAKGRSGAARGKNAGLAAQAAVSSAVSSTPPKPKAPSPEMLQAYSTSRQRVQRSFAVAAELAQYALDHGCLLSARQLCEVLEVCTSWTQLRTAEAGMARELCEELGIGVELGQTLLQLLAFCSFSTHAAAQLHHGLTAGLTLLNGGYPPPEPSLPSPPSQADPLARRAGGFGFGGPGGGRVNGRYPTKKERRAAADEASRPSLPGSLRSMGGGGGFAAMLRAKQFAARECSTSLSSSEVGTPRAASTPLAMFEKPAMPLRAATSTAAFAARSSSGSSFPSSDYANSPSVSFASPALASTSTLGMAEEQRRLEAAAAPLRLEARPQSGPGGTSYEMHPPPIPSLVQAPPQDQQHYQPEQHPQPYSPFVDQQQHFQQPSNPHFQHQPPQHPCYPQHQKQHPYPSYPSLSGAPFLPSNHASFQYPTPPATAAYLQSSAHKSFPHQHQHQHQHALQHPAYTSSASSVPPRLQQPSQSHLHLPPRPSHPQQPHPFSTPPPAYDPSSASSTAFAYAPPAQQQPPPQSSFHAYPGSSSGTTPAPKLSLEPYDAETLALLASLPAPAATGGRMGGEGSTATSGGLPVAAVIGRRGQEWDA